MAAGAGLLLGSVAYDLIEEALDTSSFLWVALWFFAGSAQAIVMGSVLDGTPESFVLGLTVVQGGISIPLLIAESGRHVFAGPGLFSRDDAHHGP